MDSHEDDIFTPSFPAPTAQRPLLGLTVLVIEDSRYACEAMRLLCLRSGARIRRADSIRAAKRHLKVYRPSVAVIDLGLPDGDGSDLIAELSASSPRPDVLLGLSGEPDRETEAMNAGADGFLAKPLASLSEFQEAILTHLPDERRPRGPRLTPSDTITPDPIAYRDDMAHVADVLDGREDDRVVDYVAQFLSGVARSAHDDPLAKAAEKLALKRAQGASAKTELALLSGLVQDRLSQKIAM